MNWQQMVQKRGAARRREERIKSMNAQRWTKVRVLGIAPFTIDRVEGTYTVEFDRAGRSLDYGAMREVKVTAFDLRYPTGHVKRFETLREARAAAALMAAERRKGGE